MILKVLIEQKRFEFVLSAPKQTVAEKYVEAAEKKVAVMLFAQPAFPTE